MGKVHTFVEVISAAFHDFPNIIFSIQSSLDILQLESQAGAVRPTSNLAL